MCDAAGDAASQVPASLLPFVIVCGFLCVYVCACSWSSVSFFRGHRLVFLEQGLPLARGSVSRLDWAGREPLTPVSTLCFLRGLWVLNIGPHAYRTSILKTEPSPSLGFRFLLPPFQQGTLTGQY